MSNTTKIRDLAVKIGERPDGQGGNKPIWRTIGAMMKGEKGEFLLLDPTFNLAGVDLQGNRSVMVSCFRVDRQDGQQAPQKQAPQQAPQQPQRTPQQQAVDAQRPANHVPEQVDDFDDSIPFTDHLGKYLWNIV